MATWKKILREDYAVGDSLGLIRLDSATTSNTIKFRLWDNSNSGVVPTTEGSGLETIDLAFATGNFSVTGTTVDLTPLQIQEGGTNSFQLYDGTNYTLNFTSSDDSITIDASTAGTIDLITTPSVIFGNMDGADGNEDPDSVNFNLGDTIIFTSSSGGVEIGPAVESNGTISLNFNLAHTDLTGTLDSSSDNYQAGVDAITFAGYSSAGYLPIASSVTGTTVSLGISDELIEDLVGAMVSSNTEHGITVTYVDNGTDAGKINFDLNNLTLAGNGGSGAIDYSAGSTLTVTGATNSGITTTASGSTITIDQADVTITGTSNNATLTPTSGITFISTDNSVTSTITNGGDGAAVTVDLEATPQVTDIADVATDTSATYNITMTSATGTGDYVAFMDNGALQWKITDDSDVETAELIVNGDLTVTGTTTTLQTQNVIVEDKLITLANPDTGEGDETSALGGGIELKAGAAATVAYPKLLWNNTGELSGWQIQDRAAAIANAAPKEVATMQFQAAAAAPAATKRGDLYYETDTNIVYVCIA